MNSSAEMDEWLGALRNSLATSEFVGIKLGRPVTPAAGLKALDARLVMVKRELRLSFTYHHQTNDIVKNYSFPEGTGIIADLLANSFMSARLFTLGEDLVLAKQPSGTVLTRTAPSQKQLPEFSHNRSKNHLIDPAGKPYLHALGVTDAKGVVHKNAQDKFRQINKFVEILDGLIKQLPPREKLRIVDMGAGKGYLTFALYDYLTTKLSLNVEIVGVEIRQNLVTLCNETAASNGFEHLRFEQGSVGRYDCTGADVVVALHACDTATDDAINQAIRANASLIVVAPCCHKQIRREIEAHESDGSLAFLMKYGTYVERISEMVTDGMRAQIMELNGYRSNLFEFIGDAHTPKNVMIVATKLAKERSAEENSSIERSIGATKARFGIKTHQLERLLGLVKN